MTAPTLDRIKTLHMHYTRELGAMIAQLELAAEIESNPDPAGDHLDRQAIAEAHITASEAAITAATHANAIAELCSELSKAA